MGANAEILLVRTDGALILQQRDDKPGITNPGYVSSFGGHIELGETPLDAALREINEETNLRIQREQLTFFRQYRKTKEKHGEDWDVYYFIVEDVDDSGLEVYEGQGYVLVRNIQELAQLKATLLIQEVVSDYFEHTRLTR